MIEDGGDDAVSERSNDDEDETRKKDIDDDEDETRKKDIEQKTMANVTSYDDWLEAKTQKEIER